MYLEVLEFLDFMYEWWVTAMELTWTIPKSYPKNGDIQIGGKILKTLNRDILSNSYTYWPVQTGIRHVLAKLMDSLDLGEKTKHNFHHSHELFFFSSESGVFDAVHVKLHQNSTKLLWLASSFGGHSASTNPTNALPLIGWKSCITWDV